MNALSALGLVLYEFGISGALPAILFRGQLLREFGQGYDVSGVGHYLVVHPAGKRDQWAP